MNNDRIFIFGWTFPDVDKYMYESQNYKLIFESRTNDGTRKTKVMTTPL